MDAALQCVDEPGATRMSKLLNSADLMTNIGALLVGKRRARSAPGSGSTRSTRSEPDRRACGSASVGSRHDSVVADDDEVHLTRARGVGDQVDRCDPVAAGGETPDGAEPAAWHPDCRRRSVEQRAPAAAGEAGEGGDGFRAARLRCGAELRHLGPLADMQTLIRELAAHGR